jgi:hypothetical protein
MQISKDDLEFASLKLEKIRPLINHFQHVNKSERNFKAKQLEAKSKVINTAIIR